MTSTPAPVPADFAADWLGQRVVFADGAFRRLPDEVSRLGAERVLLIAGRHDGLGDRAEALLGGRDPGCGRVTGRPRSLSGLDLAPEPLAGCLHGANQLWLFFWRLDGWADCRPK